MIARLLVQLPFSIMVPEGDEYQIFQYTDQGYDVRYRPPLRRQGEPGAGDLDSITVDGKPAFQAEVLVVDFHKESFERAKDGSCDPPHDLIKRALSSFILRLRHVTRAHQAREIDFPLTTWRLHYLNDDETELEIHEQLVRTRGGFEFSVSILGLNHMHGTTRRTVQSLSGRT